MKINMKRKRITISALFALSVVLSWFNASPAVAIDPLCVRTPNFGIWRCPENSTDWYDSYTIIVDTLDAVARTVPSSFTIQGNSLSIGTLSPNTAYAIHLNNSTGLTMMLLSTGTANVGQQVGALANGLSATNDFAIYSVQGRPMTIGSAGASAIYINPSQLVGIGTTAPTVRLDVRAPGATGVAIRINGGGQTVYFCDAGASVGNLCRNNVCSCVGGTWQPIGLQVD